MNHVQLKGTGRDRGVPGCLKGGDSPFQPNAHELFQILIRL